MTEKFVVTGMTCAACAAHVEKAANSLDGVDSAAARGWRCMKAGTGRPIM